ncbi:uridine kinase [Bacillus sp. NPDC077411]|uniref:uridine kinase n=1 Tax=Bacillus sp. NPDC077411 TaxID=3363947 RepID=UPI0037C99EAF
MGEKTTVISISAVSGGGKTTVTKELANRLNNAKTFHFDDYNLEGPSDICEWMEKGANYNEWNVSPIMIDIESLLNDAVVDYIILDYPFSYLNNQMKDVIDISFYIDTPLDIAMARRFIRNPLHTIDEILFECEVYLQAGREAYLEMEKSVKPNADYVIDGEMTVEHIVEAIMNKL